MSEEIGESLFLIRKVGKVGKVVRYSKVSPVSCLSSEQAWVYRAFK